MDNSRFKFRAWFPAWEEVFILSEMNGALLNGDMELMTLEVFDDLVNGLGASAPDQLLPIPLFFKR